MAEETNNKYWQTIDQWRNDPEFQKLAEQEFQSSPLKASDGEGGWARRVNQEYLYLDGCEYIFGFAISGRDLEAVYNFRS